MNSWITNWYLLAPAFLLVLARIAGLMLAAPIFSSASLPMPFKSFLAVAISLAVFPFAQPHLGVSVTLSSALVGLTGELAIGVLIGMAASGVFLSIQIAGQLIAQQSGLALGSVFNPELETTNTAGAEIYFWVALMIFLAVGGDRALMSAVVESFRSLPPLSFRTTEGTAGLLVDLLETACVLAIRLAAPATLALMLSFLTLGFISRTVPQLNLMTIGFPIKAAIGVLVMAASITALESVVLDGLADCMDAVRVVLGLSPAA